MRTRDKIAYISRERLCVQMARRVLLGRWPCMIDYGVQVGEDPGQDLSGRDRRYWACWERAERRGGDIPGHTIPGTRLHKVTYMWIRHLKSRDLSETKLIKTGMVFLWQKWGTFQWKCFFFFFFCLFVCLFLYVHENKFKVF